MSNKILFIELIFIYVFFPIIAFLELITISKFIFFLPPLVYTLFIYHTKKDKMKKQDFKKLNIPKGIILRPLLSFPFLILLVYCFSPDQLFIFPKEHFLIWIFVIISYPFFSALPQEFAYRTFFFWRYKKLIKNKYCMIVVNALCFSFLHIMYDNILAVLLTLLGGFTLALNYHKNKKLKYVFIEHSLYGQFVFTVGLGSFFYEAAQKISLQN